MKRTLKNLLAAVVVSASVTGCMSVANRIVDAMEPRLERIVDAQIEREEKLQGIWGTTNSYFYPQRSATEAEIRAQADELIAAYREELMKRVDQIIEEKFGK